MYRNSEGYADPTAGAALGNVIREERKERRNFNRKRMTITNRNKVYVVSRYAGDVEANVAAAIRYCKFAIEKRKIPVASHLLYPQILNDNIPEERELGTMFGLALMMDCDEVWCFGAAKSKGMQHEIHEAIRLNKPIRFFTTEMEEI